MLSTRMSNIFPASLQMEEEGGGGYEKEGGEVEEEEEGGDVEEERRQPPVRHQCPYCTNSYAFRQGLGEHIAKVHEGMENHHCPVCGKGFPVPQIYEEPYNNKSLWLLARGEKWVSYMAVLCKMVVV